MPITSKARSRGPIVVNTYSYSVYKEGDEYVFRVLGTAHDLKYYHPTEADASAARDAWLAGPQREQSNVTHE